MSLEAGDERSLRESLARMGLVAPGEPALLVPLAGGVSSLIVRVESAAGTLCLKRALAKLKVAADWRAPLARNAAEVAWMRVAAAIVPGCVPAILGEDALMHTFAMAYLDPRDHPVWKSQLLAGQARPQTARAVAAALAAIHRGTAHDDGLAAAFANDASFHDLRLDPYFGECARVHADCAPALSGLIASTAAARVALVHGDVSPKNILVGPRGPVLLDAECAWYGDPAFDAAFCLNHLLLKCAHRSASASAYLQCYDAFAAAYLEGAAWERRDSLEPRIARLLAAMLLARVDGKSPVEYLTDEGARGRVRAFARSLVLGGEESLARIRERWTEEHAP